MKIFIPALTVLVLLFAFSAPAKAVNLVVGISSGYPPYYYKQNGKLTGICVDMINSVARTLGIQLEYKEFPWKRLIATAQKGEVDAIMPLFKTTERERYLKFDGLELAYETNQFFTQIDFRDTYGGSLEDVANYRVGVVAGYSYGDYFDSFEFAKKVITQNDKHLVEMIQHNRFDIGVGNRYVVYHYAKLMNRSAEIKFLHPPISREMLYLGFSRNGKHHKITEEFAEALRVFRATPDYKKLLEKYGMNE